MSMKIKEKLGFLKSHYIIFKKEFLDLFSCTDDILNQIREDYNQFDDLLEIGKLNVTQFDLLKKIVLNFKENFEALATLIDKNKDKFTFLENLRKNLNGVIEEFKIVKELETFRWGDYVYDVKKDSLCSINSENLEQVVYTLEQISSYSEKKEQIEDLPETCSLLYDLMILFGQFESEFILNNVYRRPTETMQQILNIANKINTTFGHFQRMITENYFRANIQECLKRIDYWDSKLSLSQKPDSIIKLKDLMGPKLKEQCFYEFHNIFKYGFKF